MYKADIVNFRKRNYDDFQKHEVIHDYNQKMEGGMGKNDAMIGNYSCIRKTYKWYIKIHFLKEALYNVFVICSKEGEKKITKFMLFKLEVIREMLEDTHQIPEDSEFYRLKGCHFLPVIPPSRTKEKPQKEMCRLLQKQSSERILLSLQNCQDHDCVLYHVS